MDPGTLTALIEGQMAQIAGVRQMETDARNAVSGKGIDQIVQELFPGVGRDILDPNRDVVNYLQQGSKRYLRALSRGELNWEWDGDKAAEPRLNPGTLLNRHGRRLIKEATTDALITGKFAFFPSRGEDGQVRVAVLTGFLWPIYEPGDTSKVAALLQVTSAFKNGKLRFEVRRYSAGLLEVFADLDDWRKFNTATPQGFEQPHAKDRLPVVFRAVEFDANREPEGIIQTAMPAFRRYVKFATLTAFLAHRGGMEERVVKSDFYANLARTEPKHPLLAELKITGPNVVKLLDGAGSYERLSPVALADYRAQENEAAGAVQSALNMVDTGGSISGDALVEKREAFTETNDALALDIAEAFTEINELLAALAPREYAPGWRVTLKPRFTRDIAAERRQLTEEYKAGLPMSAWLSGLQSLGVAQVTEAHIRAAALLEELELPPGAGDGA